MIVTTDMDNEQIVSIISKQTGLDEHDLYEDVELDCYIDGFRIAMKYFKPPVKITKFNDIWR